MGAGGSTATPNGGTTFTPPISAGTGPIVSAGAAGTAPMQPPPGVPATCTGDFASVATDGAPYQITVNSAMPIGPLPHFWSTYGLGRMGLFLQQDKNWGEILKGHVIDGVQNLGLTSIRAHGGFHDDVGVYSEDANGMPVYDFSKSDQIYDFLVANNIAPIVELASMPSPLARDPSQTVFVWKMGISPPKDFQRWQELVYQFVKHSVERYTADVVSKWIFEVWNEPECCNGKFWKGTLEEYFQLYDHSVAGVQRALPGARVGGPVSSQPLELTGNSEAGRKFLEHVTTTNTLTPGTPGRLDVFMYHSWSFINGAVNGYFQGLDLLDSFGLTNVPIAITEFGPTWEFNLFDEPAENTNGAAFAAQTYSDIAQLAIARNKRFPLAYAWWTLSDVFDEDPYREDEPFIGAMGLISRENLHKPAYNTFKFLAQMGTEQVSLLTNNVSGVGGMATRDANGGVQIIVYNGQNPGKGPSDDKYYEKKAAQDITVTVSGLDATKPYDVTAYRVDETHGNAYAVWESLGRPKMPTFTDATWAQLRDAADSKPEPQAASQCGSTYTGRFPLSSPGVLFVKLTPTPPKPL